MNEAVVVITTVDTMKDLTARAPAILALVLIALLVLGYGVGTVLNDNLQIVYHDKTLEEEVAPPWALQDRQSPAIRPFEVIVLPESYRDLGVLQFAANELAQALDVRSGVRPGVHAGSLGATGRQMRIEIDRDQAPGVRLLARDNGIVISAPTLAEAAFGMNYLATLLHGGERDESLDRLDVSLTPSLKHRLVDFGAVGEVPDTAAWLSGDYTHHSSGLRRAFVADEPYVDHPVLESIGRQFREYVDRMATYGYNGVVMGGFLNYVNFDGVGDGFDVYPADSPYRARHAAMRDAVSEMLQYAEQIGFGVIFSTDMLALSGPLEAYLQGISGTIDPGSPELWAVYEAGVRELFEVMPEVDGLMIRIGEAGSVYNVEGWDYWSTLAVRTPEHAHLMVEAFTRAAEDFDKSIILRNWTVGVGRIGDMHTNVHTFDAVLGGLRSPSLVVSTKLVAGDFYSYLPLNPTLSVGEQPRMIEFQARREFEGFASFPNYLASMHQHAIQELRAVNPRIDGIWVWTQGGGPVRQSPMSLYPFHGFWHLIDADVYAAGHLAWNPDADVAGLTRAWVRRTIGGDNRTVDSIAEMLNDSREPVLRGMYIGPFARRQVTALGLEPPPMMWIFEWDILTSSSSVLSAIYYASRDRLGEAIADGYDAQRMALSMYSTMVALDTSGMHARHVFQQLVASLAYEASLLETLAHYRAAFLNYYHWLDSGDRASFRAWRSARSQFESSRDAHVAEYQTNLDFRAFNFFDADAGFAHARRAGLMAWLARVLFLVIVALFAVGMNQIRNNRHQSPLLKGSVALTAGAFIPWRISRARALSPSDSPLIYALPVLLLALILLTSTSFLSPAVIVVAALLLGVVVGVTALPGGADARANRVAALGGSLLVAAFLPLAVVAFRGPPYFWFLFWTSDLFRIVASMYGVVTFGWILVAVYSAGRAGGDHVLPGLAHVAFIAAAPPIVLGLVLRVVGLERGLTLVNDQLVILPLGLSRILGITTHLNIPLDVPIYLIGAGGLIAAVGLLFWAASQGMHRSRVVAS